MIHGTSTKSKHVATNEERAQMVRFHSSSLAGGDQSQCWLISVRLCSTRGSNSLKGYPPPLYGCSRSLGNCTVVVCGLVRWGILHCSSQPEHVFTPIAPPPTSLMRTLASAVEITKKSLTDSQFCQAEQDCCGEWAGKRAGPPKALGHWRGSGGCEAAAHAPTWLSTKDGGRLQVRLASSPRS
jgi:hypothetical protein